MTMERSFFTRRPGRVFALLTALVSVVILTGCWAMQAIPWQHDDDTETDTATDSETETETESATVDPAQSCNIDILFVIDSSQSMMLTLNNLVADGFSGFINMMESYPQPGTIRVAVANHLWGVHNLNGVDVDTSGFLTEGWPPGMPHNIDTCQEVPSVDCEFASGQKWMEGPSDTLAEEFTCVGNLPCQEDLGVGEPTIQSGLDALNYEESTGFIRNDALLFVVFITDEDDQSQMSPGEMREILLQLKEDEELILEPEDYVYVASIGGNQSGGCIDGDFFGEADATPGLIAFTAQFENNGRHFDMCVTSIETALSMMSSMMQLGCNDVFDL